MGHEGGSWTMSARDSQTSERGSVRTNAVEASHEAFQ